ncbi:LytTR family DNA-binding domain-containing protein [Spongiivirga sp. MCCC 1A20706]|uniref:LytTR family transcriptional regulator DNA-binding domain-containing protein n=1 Tax=Spongiivirga sp. MCCC 1A20706 TaxID=3160963 RepID=UPI0039774B40
MFQGFKNLFKTSVRLTLIIVILKWIFQIIPTINLLDWREYLVVFIYSLLLTIVNAFIINYLDKNYYLNSIPKKRLFISIICVAFVSLVLIALIRFIKVVLIYQNNLSDFLFQERVVNFLFPLLITFIMVLFYSSYLLFKKNRSQSKKLLSLKPDNELLIKGKGKFDYLKIPFKDLIYVKSDGNYFEVFYLMEGIMKNKLMRGVLKDVEKLHSNIRRADRSHLFSMIHFTEIIKRDNSMYLLLKDNIVIPISRKESENLRIAFKSSQKQASLSQN